MPLRKEWQAFRSEGMRRIPATVGVYELGDAEGRVIYIGYAGGRTSFGLRGVIADHFGDAQTNGVIASNATQFRVEIVQMYMSRYMELLEQHVDAHSELPAANREPGEYVPSLGKRRARAIEEAATPGPGAA